MTTEPAEVLHLAPADLARGAQVFARSLCDALDGRPDRHRTVTLFDAPPGVLRPEHRLGVAGHRARRLGLDPRAATRLARLLRRTRPQILVAHGGEALKYAVLARPGRTRLVYKKTGTSEALLGGTGHTRLYRWLAGRADAAVAVSEHGAAEARHLFGMPAARVRVIPNGRDPDVFSPPAARAVPARPCVAFVGQLEPGKRPELFLEVLDALNEAASGVMIGDGPLLDHVRRSAPPSVRVLGRRDDVADLLRDADVLVSCSDAEGMSGVLIEAGLTGLPVVTTDVSGARDVVQHGVSGLVVPVGDGQALLEATCRLVRDAGLRVTMGAAARERCVTGFSIDASVAAWGRLFDELLGRGAEGPSPGERQA